MDLALFAKPALASIMILEVGSGMEFTKYA